MNDATNATGERLPATIGRYQITGVLGSGAMGAVYKAFDPLIKRTLAIKTIRLDVPENSQQHKAFIERFYQEARISGTLSHPNIVTLFDIGEEGGRPFLAMEYIDGRTISAILEDGGRFKPERVIALVSQIAAALDYAHSRGVIHRDVKPANLMLFDRDRVKVTDFGIAKMVDADITHAGALIGTPSYMSPEQALGEKLDGRSDIFSLGVCAFEMLSGQQPFPGPNVTSILYKLVHAEPVEPVDLEASGLVPDKWRAVFQKALAKKPANRYALASDFVRDLEYCLGSWFTGLSETPGLDADAYDPTIRLQGQDIASQLAAMAASAGRPGSSSGARAGGARPATDTDPETIRVFANTAPPMVPSSASPVDGATVLLRPPSPGPRGASASDAARDAAATVARIPMDGETAEGPVESTLLLPEEPSPSPVESATLAPVAPPPAATAPLPSFPMPPPPAAMAGARPAPKRAASWAWLGAGGAVVVGLAVVGGVLLARKAGKTAPAVVPGATSSTLAEETIQPTPAPSAAQPAATVAAGSLRIESEPAGARVRLNGQRRGQTPLELTELPYGAYEIRFEQRGYDPQTRRATLTEAAPNARVQARLRKAAAATGLAEIVSTPPGAMVLINGQPVGQTPIAALALPPGTRSVQIRLDGYEPWSGEVRVVAGSRARLEAPLRPLPKAAPTPEPVDVDKVYAENEVDVKARRVGGNSPSYPGSAPRLRSGQRVSVLLRFVVTSSGEVRDITIVESGGKMIDDVVSSAVRGWKYEPASKRGVKVHSETLFRQTFLGG